MTFKSKLSEKSLSFIDLQKVIEDYMSHLRRCLILNLFLSSALSDSGLVFVVDKSSRVVSFLGGGGDANKQNLFNNYRVFIKYSSTRRKV